MAAGLGFKDFTTGEVLTAADVDGYLMQGVWVFASAAARDAAVTSPQEGNFAYLKDTNTTTYYTGSAWTNLDTTGMVNPMTTTGDTIYSSSGSTPARLGIGSTGQVLTVSGGVPTWATPAAGGKVLQVVQGTTTTQTTVTSTTPTDSGLSVSITPSSASSKILLIVSQMIQITKNSTDVAGGWRLMRDSTQIFDGIGTSTRTLQSANLASSANLAGYWAMNYLDSPATTSSTTYKTQIKCNTTSLSGTIIAQESSAQSTIIALEIGA